MFKSHCMRAIFYIKSDTPCTTMGEALAGFAAAGRGEADLSNMHLVLILNLPSRRTCGDAKVFVFSLEATGPNSADRSCLRLQVRGCRGQGPKYRFLSPSSSQSILDL